MTGVWMANQLKRLKKLLSRPERSHSWLLSGLEWGKRHEILSSLVSFLLCRRPLQESSCGSCNSCKYFQGLRHPDFLVILPADNPSIGIEASHNIIKFLTTSPVFALHKVVVVPEAHLMTREAAAALLKTFEEPLGEPFLFLVTEFPQLIPSTLRSRLSYFSFTSALPEAVDTTLRLYARDFITLLHAPLSERLQYVEKKKSEEYKRLFFAWELALRDILRSINGLELLILHDRDLKCAPPSLYERAPDIWRGIMNARTLLLQGKVHPDSAMLAVLAAYSG